MSLVYKITAVAVINSNIVDFELLFTDRDEADKACEFLKNLEEISSLEFAIVIPLTFKEFKQKLGERFDVIASQTDLRGAQTANTVAA